MGTGQGRKINMRKTGRFEEGPCPVDIFDVHSLPKYGQDEIRFRFENTNMRYRKITQSALDLYLLDPEYREYQHFFRPEWVLYQNGYKLVNFSTLGVKKIERRTFNDDGLLVRQESSYWSDVYDPPRNATDIIDWGYFPEQLMVLKKTFDLREGRIRSVKQYLLDPSFRIIRRVLRCPSRYMESHDYALDVNIVKKMLVLEESIYKYDDKGRIEEVDIKDIINPGGSDKIIFVYDAQDRIIRRKTYDSENMLDEEEVIEPLNENQINYDFRFRIYEFDEADLHP
jgi:hypothetical protein